MSDWASNEMGTDAHKAGVAIETSQTAVIP